MYKIYNPTLFLKLIFFINLATRLKFIENNSLLKHKICSPKMALIVVNFGGPYLTIFNPSFLAPILTPKIDPLSGSFLAPCFLIHF